MQQPTNVVKFFDIKGKFMKARYYWRFTHCSYGRLAEHVEISEVTAMRWVRLFNIDNNIKDKK